MDAPRNQTSRSSLAKMRLAVVLETPQRKARLLQLVPACNRWKLEVSCKSRTASVENSSRYCFEIRVTEGSG